MSAQSMKSSTQSSTRTRMRVNVLDEWGYSTAIHGLSLCYRNASSNMQHVAKKISNKDEGHNKFLEHIMVSLQVTAPRSWWQQADTYRISSKQSESTMNTIMRWPLKQGNFVRPIHPPTLERLRDLQRTKNFRQLKDELPEGYLQTRVWLVSYKELRRIVKQRHNHRLLEWQLFCRKLALDVQHPEFLS